MSTHGHMYASSGDMGRCTMVDDIGGNAIVYSYPNGDFDIVCAAEKTFLPPGWEKSEDFSHPGSAAPCGAEKTLRQKGVKSEGDDLLRSMRRARAKLRRLALSNEFTHFVTLTLDKEKVDRYDPKAIMQKVNRCFDNLVRRHGLKYILVPEQHKDGAYHFHGFIAGDLRLEDSGTIDLPWEEKPKRPRDDQERADWLSRGGHVVYNWPQWPLGFTTALPLYGTYSAAVAYVCKYIGKQQGQRPMGRWYYSGGGLKEPQRLYTTLEYSTLGQQFPDDAVEFAIPGTQMVVIHHRTDKEEQHEKKPSGSDGTGL